MNNKQCYLFGVVSYLIGALFMKISLEAGQLCTYYKSTELTLSVVHACVRSQVFSPFVYIFIILGFAFFIAPGFNLNSEKKKEIKKK